MRELQLSARAIYNPLRLIWNDISTTNCTFAHCFIASQCSRWLMRVRLTSMTLFCILYIVRILSTLLIRQVQSTFFYLLWMCMWRMNLYYTKKNIFFRRFYRFTITQCARRFYLNRFKYSELTCSLLLACFFLSSFESIIRVYRKLLKTQWIWRCICQKKKKVKLGINKKEPTIFYSIKTIN